MLKVLFAESFVQQIRTDRPLHNRYIEQNQDTGNKARKRMVTLKCLPDHAGIFFKRGEFVTSGSIRSAQTFKTTKYHVFKGEFPTKVFVMRHLLMSNLLVSKVHENCVIS